MPVLNGTRGGLLHMEIQHQRDPKTGQLRPKATSTKSDYFNLVSETDFNRFKILLINWIVYCQLAFFMLESSYFQELIKCLNHAIGALLPRSRSTLRQWINNEFERRKKKLKTELSKVRPRYTYPLTYGRHQAGIA